MESITLQHFAMQIKNDVKVYFFVDGKADSVPTSISNELKSVPLEEFDDKLISFLIATDLYQDVTVEQAESPQNETVFIAKATSIKRIQNIEFKGLNSADQINFSRFLSLQVGVVFRPALLKSDAAKLQNELRMKGYPNAEVLKFHVENLENHFVKITYDVNKGVPCHIDQVVIENKNLSVMNFMTNPVEIGSLCDFSLIKDKLEIIKENYIENGYLNAEVKIKDMIYSESKESAKVILQIEKGLETKIQIVDEKNNFLDFNFFNTQKAGLTYADINTLSDSDLKELVIGFYQKQGYAFVKILNFEKVADKKGNITVKFQINKGKFLKIGTPHFIGSFPETEDQMMESLKIKKRFFSFQDIPFVESELEDYKDRLKDIFIKHGYLDAIVATPDFIYPDQGNAVDLYFTAEQGDRYVVSKILVQGMPKKFNLNQTKLDEIFKEGDALSLDKRQAYEEEYRNQLLAQGYLYAQVKIEQVIEQDLIEDRTRYINWHIRIAAGQIVHIRNIYAQGDLFGKEQAIIAVSGLEKGDLFTQENLNSARLQVLRHDLFSSVAIEPLDSNALNHRETDLDVIIRTKARGGFGLALMPGYGTLRGYKFNADFTLNKLNNDGLRLISSGGVSQELQQQSFATTDTQQILGQQLNLGFTESLFKLWGIETPLDVSTIAGYQVVAEALTNRQYQTLKFISEWKPTFFGKPLTYTTTFLHESSIATSSESAVVQTIDSPSIRIREFLNGVSLDTRNSTGWPTSGGLYSMQFGMARFGMGSDVQYNRYLANIDYFFPIYKRLSGAISFGGSFVEDTINRSGATVTPPASRRSTLTDDALIRGFPETYGSAAPGPLLWIHYANNGVPNCNTQLASTGGTKLVYLKSEARYRINDNFGAIMFMDSGESYFTPSEVNQVNNQIAQQIASGNSSSTQCVVDNASLVSPTSLNAHGADIFAQYWQQAYVSAGVGLRVILGNYATINLDYGYPLKDPASNLSNCVSTSQAQNSSTAPTCITRIQDSTYLWGLLNFQGAIHFGIGAKF